MMNFILLTSAILNSDVDPIVEIGRNTLETAENTRFGIIALIAFVVSIMTLVFSILTFISQKATQKNTSRLSKKSQDIILQNITGQIYCNLVNLYSVIIKIEEDGYKTYPSEEIFEKMKIDTSQIRPYFYQHNRAIDQSLRVETRIQLIKNFNIDVDILNHQLKDVTIEQSIKKEKLHILLTDCLKLLNDIRWLFLNIVYYIPPKYNIVKLLKIKLFGDADYIKESFQKLDKDMLHTIESMHYIYFNRKKIYIRENFPRKEDLINLDDLPFKDIEFNNLFWEAVACTLGEKKTGLPVLMMIPLKKK